MTSDWTGRGKVRAREIAGGAEIAIDGVTSNDQGSPNVFSSVTSLDAIGEVKVLLNSYQAEYAGNGGPIVQVVTKSGGKDFHGTAYDLAGTGTATTQAMTNALMVATKMGTTLGAQA